MIGGTAQSKVKGWPLPGWLSPAAVAAAVLVCAGCLMVFQAGYIHAKALVAQVLLERAFSQSLVSGVPVKPWSWADIAPEALVEIPRLGERAIVLSGSSGQALAFGPGHVSGTPKPGEPGTAVIAAHRDTHFAFLGDLEAGDLVRVTARDGIIAEFRVTGSRIVRWDRSGIATRGHPGEPARLVLATCWPLDARSDGPLRYLVEAEAIGTEPSSPGGLPDAAR